MNPFKGADLSWHWDSITLVILFQHPVRAYKPLIGSHIDAQVRTIVENEFQGVFKKL